MIRRKRGGEELYVLKDYLDPAAIIDTGGNVVERFGYDAFGPARFMAPDFSPRPSSAADWNFLFHAEFLDEDTGLYNYGYRYYNPELGRWISRDPIGERGGLNLYGFLHNDAIWTFDYLGLSKNWFQESSFDCEIVFFFGHARNPSLTQGERTSINTVAIAVYQYNTEADSRKTGKLRRALALGMCCNAWIPKDKETQETKTINPSTAPKITSNIGVKDDVEHYWNNMKKADQPETPHGLVDPTSPSANNQISGTSQNAIPSDFDPEYFGKLDQQQKWNAQQSIGAVRVAMQMWKHYEAGACNCGCDEVLMRIVFVGENAKGKFTQRQNYVSHLTAEARARMGLADFPWGENFQKTIPCKK
jgi:RHS repeat-associated protein